MFLLLGCFHKKDSGYLDNTELLSELEALQKMIAQNNGKLFSRSKDPLYVTKSNFSKAFDFLDEKDKMRFYRLFSNDKIIFLKYQSTDNCMIILIRPFMPENILIKSWDELYIVYENNCDCVCRKRININEDDIADDKIEKLKENWYKVIATHKRKLH